MFVLPSRPAADPFNLSGGVAPFSTGLREEDSSGKRKVNRAKSTFVPSSSKIKKSKEERAIDFSGASGLNAVILFEEIDTLLDHDRGYVSWLNLYL